MLIRKMSEADLDEVSELEKSCFSTPWTREDFFKSLQNEDNDYLVAEEEGEIIGYCGYWGIKYFEAQINNFAVREDSRKKGVGTALLKELLRIGKEEKVAEFLLEVRASNYPAQKLYKKFGFSELAVRKGYYIKPTEDAIIMLLKLETTNLEGRIKC